LPSLNQDVSAIESFHGPNENYLTTKSLARRSRTKKRPHNFITKGTKLIIKTIRTFVAFSIFAVRISFVRIPRPSVVEHVLELGDKRRIELE
jgi:hypothetical protein